MDNGLPNIREVCQSLPTFPEVYRSLPLFITVKPLKLSCNCVYRHVWYKITAFCARSFVMCQSMLLTVNSHLTAIISLYSIHQLFFLIEAQCSL